MFWLFFAKMFSFRAQSQSTKRTTQIDSCCAVQFPRLGGSFTRTCKSRNPGLSKPTLTCPAEIVLDLTSSKDQTHFFVVASILTFMLVPPFRGILDPSIRRESFQNSLESEGKYPSKTMWKVLLRPVSN